MNLKLVATPDDRVQDLGRLIGVDRAWPQGGGDLGQRLHRASVRAFDEGASAVLLFGADSPTFPLNVLGQAADVLATHDVALGVCDDGGYYLMGLSRPCPELFQDIDWGGSDVARQTRDHAESVGLSVGELAEWYDLDRFSDLKRAAGDLVDLDDRAPGAMMSLRRLINEFLGSAE